MHNCRNHRLQRRRSRHIRLQRQPVRQGTSFRLPRRPLQKGLLLIHDPDNHLPRMSVRLGHGAIRFFPSIPKLETLE